MDEYNQGMDPEVKIYFRKIMKSFAAGLVWFLIISTLAFSFKMAHIKDSLSWKNYVFYFLFFVSLAALVYYLLKVWRKDLTRSK